MTFDHSSNEILEFFISYVHILQKLVPIDCTIGVTDTEKFIYSVPGEKIKMPPDIVGSPIPEEDAVYLAIQKAKPVDVIVPASAFGFPFKACGVPIKDKNGTVIGGLGLGISLENREQLLNISELVATSTEQTYAAVEELAASAGELANHQIKLNDLSEKIDNSIKDTKGIIDFIQSISKSTKLLSLNAAIESARAGDAGKGFSVVASEMRKMAESTANSIKDIEKVLEDIRSKVSEIAIGINESVSISEQQASATEEISSTMRELASSAETLNKSASNVVG